MSEVTITVRGEYEERVAPEEAVAHIVVRAEGPERAPVVDLLSSRSAPIGADLTARQAQGALLRWSSQRMFVWSERPWADGRRLAPVHHASIELAAVFADAPTLSAWLGEVAERDGIDIGAIEWQLSRETAKQVESAVAARAVEVAVERATAYASAIGCTHVVPLEIADAGLLGNPDGTPAPRMLRAAAMLADGGSALDLRPEDITVTATVEARFFAR
ncbi:SIMPL domain-containing protein [Microbacterium sp. X-17]|uniref:SIMPL domain-containing protein n=1 Tax=Microbacterium sp. X-17 TaxID=3144404 RepID=UPI0031F57EDE